MFFFRKKTHSYQLDPVGSTVRYEMMKQCSGSVQGSNGWYLVVLSQCEAVPVGQLVIDETGSEEGINAFIFERVEIWSGDTDP